MAQHSVRYSGPDVNHEAGANEVEEWLEQLTQRAAVSANGRITAGDLKAKLGLESEYLARRIFSVFDRSRRGSVDINELVDAIRNLLTAPTMERLRFAFEVYDENRDGLIEHHELLKMLHISLAENRLVLGEDFVEVLALAFFERADRNRDGYINFEEFALVLGSCPGVEEQLAFVDLAWLGLQALPSRASLPPRRSFVLAQWMRTHRAWLTLFTTYLIANGWLFVAAVMRYRAAGGDIYLQLARGAGACLNLHAGLVLLPMARHLLTRFRRTPIGSWLIDDEQRFHAMVGNVGFWLGVFHSLAHGARAWTGAWQNVFGKAGITGLVLLLVYTLMWGFAWKSLRRSKRFTWFHKVHRLWPIWAVFTLLHGPQAWKYMAIPLVLILIDRLFLRRARMTVMSGAVVLPARVTRMTVTRPTGFAFRAGDYAWLRIPEVSTTEWHPFTISSAPERSDALTFHVRVLGDWTADLHGLISRRASGGDGLVVYVDGPYGTASSRIINQDSVLMIAAGIGVTPFASVLSSMLQRHREGRPIPSRIHFVWLCAEQAAFGWFAEMLAEFEAVLGSRSDILVYLTAGRSDVRSSVLRVAADTLYATTRLDLVTGLRARTKLEQPNWEEIISGVVANNRPKAVAAFYCGPDAVGRMVRSSCQRNGVIYRQEYF